MALDATVGAETANSYVTRDEAVAYFSDRLGAESIMEEVDDSVLDRALVTASQLLDNRIAWIGDRAEETQGMEWPRIDLNEEPIFAADAIPTKVKKATFELAKYLIENGDPLNAAVLESVQVSSLRINFKKEGVQRTMIPDEVASIVSDYGQRRSPITTLREVALYR